MSEDHLDQWLRIAHETLCFELTGNRLTAEELEEEDVETMLLTVASGVFGFDFTLVDDVKEEIKRNYSIQFEDASEFKTIIEYLLIQGVSSECHHRAVLVNGIMNRLDSTTQALLMHIIQSHQQASSADEDDVPTESTAARVPSQKLQKDDECTSIPCGQCTYHENISKRLSAEITSLQEQSHQEIINLQKQIEDEKAKFIDAELIIVQKDEKIHQINNTMIELQNQLLKMEGIIERNHELEEEISQLNDQIDVLKPQADKLIQTEALLEKLRDRLEEMSSLKHQLQLESTKHNATHSQLLELEQEVQQLRKLKPQLDEYRDQYTESMITINELTVRLKEKEDMNELFLKEMEILKGNNGHHMEQSQQLAEELHATAERLRETERTGGIGEGISELNPELMHQIKKLQKEKEELQKLLNESSIEELERKNKQIIDSKNINSSLQKKLITTKDSLDYATNQILELNQQLEELKIKYFSLENLLKENLLMKCEEIDSLKNIHLKKLSSLQKQHDTNLAEMHVTHTGQIQQLNDKLSVLTNDFEETTNQLKEMTTLQNITSTRLDDTQNSLFEVTNKRKREQIEYNDILDKTKLEFNRQLHELHNQHEQEIIKLKNNHSIALSKESQRINELNIELEEEAIKRRKIERQKKFHELESQRQKSQLQAAGANGLIGSRAVNEELECAVKEMKYMQQQLDAAKAEIIMLRSVNNESSPIHTKVSNVMNFIASPRIKTSSDPLSISSSNDPITSNTIHASAVRTAERSHDSVHQQQISGAVVSNNTVSDGSNYFEQVEFAERRIEQLIREKREMLSKNLEETKEKNELSQKLLLVERENTSLKADIRKLTLEKERAERKLRKQSDVSNSSTANKENVMNE